LADGFDMPGNIAKIMQTLSTICHSRRIPGPAMQAGGAKSNEF
jgi:hypothetical protein